MGHCGLLGQAMAQFMDQGGLARTDVSGEDQQPLRPFNTAFEKV